MSAGYEREMEAIISGFSVLGEWNCVEKSYHGKHSIEFVVDDASGLPLGDTVTLRIERKPDPQQELPL